MSGYVYILSNPAFPHLIKIGKSDRDPIEFRAAELYTTGVPHQFSVEYYAFVDNHHHLEAECHKLLVGFRPNKGREFFEYPIPEAIALIRRVAPVVKSEKVIYRTPEEIKQAEIRFQKEEQEKERAREKQRLESEQEEANRQSRRKSIDAQRQKYVDEILNESEWIPSVMSLGFGLMTLMLLLIGFGDGVLWPFVVVAAMWGIFVWVNASRRESAVSKAANRYPYA